MKAADDYADKAETKGDLTMLAKSNSMRKKAMDKQQELDNNCQQLFNYSIKHHLDDCHKHPAML